jgi:hypothetical protein
LHENSQEGGSLCAFIYRLVLPFTVLAQGYTAPFSKKFRSPPNKESLGSYFNPEKKKIRSLPLKNLRSYRLVA